MSSLLTLDRVSLAAPDGRILFFDLTLAVGRERIGIVGKNGSGKSTLLRTIAARQAPLHGRITLGGSTLGTLHQMSGEPVGSAARLLGVSDALDCLGRIESGAGSEADFEVADWALPERIDHALHRVEMAGADLDRPAASFSGGERMRLAVAALLIARPDLLLLDEPTNDLDADGRALIAHLVADWQGGLMIASHDRSLLEGVDRIVSLSPQEVTLFGGGWSAFSAMREAACARITAEAERAAAQLSAAACDAQAARERQARRDAGGRAFAATGSAPKIGLGLAKRRAEATAGRVVEQGSRMLEAARERLADVQARVERQTPLTMTLAPVIVPPTRTVLRLEAITVDHGSGALFPPLHLTLRGPERIAISGPNGSGKSSLLRVIAGLEAPSSGTIESGVPKAYLDQGVGLLDPCLTLIENLRRYQPRLSDNAAYAALANFAFRNLAALRRADELSGGERLRAGLACVMSADPAPMLLILDEPTNHLDVESLEVLETALSDFTGALILVSHDRAFLKNVQVDRILQLGTHSALQ